MANAVKFKQTKVSKQPGEVARLRVVQGPDAGSLFVLVGAHATMGRGDENDIVLADLKASRRHAEILANPGGAWYLRDLGSSNGILLDGQVVREGSVRRGTRFTVGDSVLEFLLPDGALTALPAAMPAAVPIGIPAGIPAGIAGIGASGGSSGGINKRFLVYGAVILAVVMMPGEDAKAPKKNKKEKNPAEVARDLASFLPDYEAGRSGPAEAFFREGFREYREQNYLRAKTQFETVLQISPSHYLASVYLRNCEQAIDAEVKAHLEQGKKDAESGKLKSARNHYESVMRLLHRDTASSGYQTAKEAIVAVEKAMKGEAK